MVTPSHARTSTWLVVVADHKNGVAHVLFNTRGPTKAIRVKDAEREDHVEFALRRVFDALNGCVTVEGVHYGRLESSAGGGFYATALASACVRSFPDFPVHDEKTSLAELSALAARLPDPPKSTAVGSTSQVVARISRHDGRLRWT